MSKPVSLLEPLREECRILLSVLGKPFFLHLCQSDGFLFISDLPRHVPHKTLAPVLHSIENNGFTWAL
ncbi:MAG: hypothetical protein FWF86_09070, partial [Clostridia bacterium]|nr:hypothetical protein [Clostridia bacterium]